MKASGLAFAACLLIAISSAIAAEPARRSPSEVDIGEMLKETTWQRIDPSGVQLAVWFPTEYWEAFLARERRPVSQAHQVVELMSGFLLFAVVKGVPVREDVYESAEALRSQFSVKLADGTILEPLPEQEWPRQLAAALTALKPTLSASMGPMGSGVHFIVLRGKDASGSPLVDATAPGKMEISMSGTSHSYRFPLGSLLQPMRDPASGESFPGNYVFNPFTGNALQADRTSTIPE